VTMSCCDSLVSDEVVDGELVGVGGGAQVGC
jgi:hypothetical protein